MDEENTGTEQQTSGNVGQAPGDGASAKPVSYTQDDLNRMFGERAKQAETALLKKLGFERTEDAESLIKKTRETEEAQKTELQKAQEKAAALEKREAELLEKQRLTEGKADVIAKAANIGIADAIAAYRMLDKSKLEYDAGGQPTNTEQVLRDLLKEFPILAGTGTSAANPAKNRGGAGTFTKSQVADRAFWNAHKDEIMKAMSEGRIVDD